MKIYSRDYTTLTQEEIDEWEVLNEKEIVRRIGKGDLAIRKGRYREYPVAVRHFISLYPNNHLDIVDLQQIEQLTTSTEEFHQIIVNPASNERSILNWIREEKAYFIIASIMKGFYSFGHHDAFKNRYQVHTQFGNNSELN
ncbi:hypothetical protein [Sporosarcina ureae]|uniref:hypothetical protein n=1 Tax=Sporosarcina ureae TaxID=1571 RepID=UPI001AD80E39|nr:hypothetical protein [Sporosarcina ureae]